MATTTPTTPAPASTTPADPTAVPTKINAGQSTPGGPTTSLILLAAGLVLAAIGGVAHRLRTVRSHG